MKAFTDIEQSKKLAEILPIESADGFYEAQHNHLTDKWEYILFTGNKWASEEVVIPCWSLAALLNVVSEVSLNSFKDGNWTAMVQPNSKIIYSNAGNPIDACVEMIIKLHEEKLL